MTSAVVDAVTTPPAGSPATATASITDGVLHLTFGIPQGLQRELGPQGDVTLDDLTTALNSTSANSNAVGNLSVGLNDPPTGAEVQQVVDKVDGLIQALRR